MKHLITGGSGFLGHLIAKRLLQKGEKVRIFDLWDDPKRPSEIEWIQGDICDRSSLKKAMQGVDIVHHNAAMVPLTKATQEFKRVNVEGSKIAAEEALKAHVKTFVHMSSSALFGDAKSPITDQTKPCPVEPYGLSKLQGELEVQKTLNASSTSLIIIRPRTILGEGRMGIFQLLFDWIHKGKSVFVIGKGNIPFQFIHAHDLMDAYMLAIEKGTPGIYNVGTEHFGTLRGDLEHLITFAQSSSKVRSLPEKWTIGSLRFLDKLSLSPLAPWHYLTYHKEFYFDLTPLKQLGWSSKYSNRAMLEESYLSYLSTGLEKKSSSLQSAHRTFVREKILWMIHKFF